MNTILFVILAFFSVGTIVSMETDPKVEYAKGLGHNDAFYSADGWGRELITAHLNVPGFIVGAIFPPPVAPLSVTATMGSIPIGHCNSNMWQDFLNQLPKNLTSAIEQNNQEGVKKFVEILARVHDVESTALLEEFKRRNIPISAIAHNAGLMVLKQFQSKGIGNQLQNENLQLLKEKGVRAIVSETTNKHSAKIMEKQGFTKFAEFSYAKDFQINDIDDSYTIWFKDMSAHYG